MAKKKTKKPRKNRQGGKPNGSLFNGRPLSEPMKAGLKAVAAMPSRKARKKK